MSARRNNLSTAFARMNASEARQQLDHAIEQLERGDISPDDAKAVIRAANLRRIRVQRALQSLRRAAERMGSPASLDGNHA
jgi:hypothetical protein